MFQRFVDHCICKGPQYIPFRAKRPNPNELEHQKYLFSRPYLHLYCSSPINDRIDETWIICHGGGYTLEPYTAEFLTFRDQLMQCRQDMGFQILSVEYPYSKEASTDASIKQHYVEMLEQVITKNQYPVDWQKTIIVGRCLGAYAACLICNRHPEIKSCILLAMMPPIRTLFNRIVGSTLSRFLIKSKDMFELSKTDLAEMRKSRDLSVICIQGCRDHLYSVEDLTAWLKEMNFHDTSLIAVHNLGHDLSDINNTLELILTQLDNHTKSTSSVFHSSHIINLPIKFSLGTSISVK